MANSKEEILEELIEYLFLTYLDFSIDRIKSRENLLPRLRVDMILDIPDWLLELIPTLILPPVFFFSHCLTHRTLFHFKIHQDTLTQSQFYQYLAELLIFGSKEQEKSPSQRASLLIFTTYFPSFLKEERFFPLKPCEETPWMYEIQNLPYSA
ncbi:MAG: hypothetical protein D6785_10090 [Planctomycetota bacterium]|nr:MAG: hypothetical protein D6785_10090 [Planctomycetota bacterium]